MRRAYTILFALVFLTPAMGQRVNPELLAEIGRIQAVDNHAHPVIPGGTDRDFDALPVDDMAPTSDPVRTRPDNPEIKKASSALYGSKKKDAVKNEQGVQYPAWVLDKLGVEVMIANRVSMGQGIVAPRFRWVSYVDALMFPLDNSGVAMANSDRKIFFGLEDRLLRRYLDECGLRTRPANFDEYLSKVVTATLERHKKGGAIGVKFEAAYLRALDFGNPPKAAAARVYAAGSKGVPGEADYKALQDYIFRYIALEAGRLGLAVHLHTMTGPESYFNVAGANPLLLEPVLNDPALRKTNFVMIHGGWPFTTEIGAMLFKPNAYLDFSGQTLINTPRTVARAIREWLELVPEKVMFATDAYPYSAEMDWEESAWMGAQSGRLALAIALSGMIDDGEITYQRAVEIARMVLRDNAKRLYSF